MRGAKQATIALLALSALSCRKKPEPLSQPAQPSRPPKPAELSESERATLAKKRQFGGRIYAEMCSVCHGKEAEGYAADRAPKLAQQNFLASASDGFLARAIAEGRAGTTMSAWGIEHGGPLSDADVEAVVAFLRGFQKLPAVELDERPPSGDAARAAPVYEAECLSCHGARGVGGPEMKIGGMSLLNSASDGFLRYAVQKGRPGTPMEPFESRLSAQQIEDLVTLLRSWQVAPPESAAQKPQPPLPLGPVPLNPKGPDPAGFQAFPEHTPVDVVKAALDAKSRLVLLDSRVPSDYMNEHITGAVSVPFYAPEPYFAELPKDAWLVCYCGCPHAESRALAAKLVANGFRRVTVLDEGLGVWKARGYPVSASPVSKSPRP